MSIFPRISTKRHSVPDSVQHFLYDKGEKLKSAGTQKLIKTPCLALFAKEQYIGVNFQEGITSKC